MVLTQQDATNHSHNVSIVTRLLAGRSGVRVLKELRYFSLLQIIQTDCGIHPTATQWRAAFFPGGKRSRGMMLNTHLRLGAEVKNKWSYPRSLPYAFISWTVENLFIFFTLCQSAELTLAVCHIRVEPYNVLTISHVRLFKACSNPLHRVMDHRFHCVASEDVCIYVRIINLRIYFREISVYSV
jgi:hypothetical protein